MLNKFTNHELGLTEPEPTITAPTITACGDMCLLFTTEAPDLTAGWTEFAVDHEEEPEEPE